jgi:transposase
MRTLTLSNKHLRRAEILTRLVSGKLSATEAAQLLGLTTRQVRRLRSRYLTEGVSSLVHGNTGRAPVNRTEQATVERLRSLCGAAGTYHDFNVSHLAEVLARDQGLGLPRSTLRRLLLDGSIRPAPAPRREVKRQRRERRSQEGALFQIDGSPHDWLEGRGPRMSLVGAVDDATGKLVYARFRPTEDQAGYLLMLRSLAEGHGLPEAFYHDRHTILRSPKEPTIEDELAGKRPMSQVQAVLAGLGIRSIPALSPQAKGRVERLWRTLQDRLTKELRLASVSTLEGGTSSCPPSPPASTRASVSRRATPSRRGGHCPQASTSIITSRRARSVSSSATTRCSGWGAAFRSCPWPMTRAWRAGASPCTSRPRGRCCSMRGSGGWRIVSWRRSRRGRRPARGGG